jgi:hypothetical protein
VSQDRHHNFQATAPTGYVKAGQKTYVGNFPTGALPPSSTALPPCMTSPHPTPVTAAIAPARGRRDFMVANPNAPVDAAAMAARQRAAEKTAKEEQAAATKKLQAGATRKGQRDRTLKTPYRG